MFNAEALMAAPLSGGHTGARAAGGSSSPPLFTHVLAAAWVATMLLLSGLNPDEYSSLLQEDRPVEWGTVWLFFAAGALLLGRAIGQRRAFDALVGLFCLFVAGEEFSWGQRLLGFGTPEYFMANNYQQEINLHNLPGEVFRPKWILIAALAGYGLLLPLARRAARDSRWLDKLGATAPAPQLSVWFAVCVALLFWYPVTLTGEWVEFLAGALFLFSVGLSRGSLWIALSVSLIFGVSLTKASSALQGQRDAPLVACAEAEAQGLVRDLTAGDAATEKFTSRKVIHKRVRAAELGGYVVGERAVEFKGAGCGDAARRREYGVDPWGMSYWVHVQRTPEGAQRVAVYSFGPNRRRDGRTGVQGGDDVFAVGVLARR